MSTFTWSDFYDDYFKELDSVWNKLSDIAESQPHLIDSEDKEDK